MEGLYILVAIVASLAVLDALAAAFGAESREAFVDPRRAPKPSI
jgi:hypothetical protein